MKFDRLSRRHVLQGLGASLALPVLPSLLSKTAQAQALPVQKTFIGVLAQNGLYRMYGPDSQLMPPLPVDYAAYKTRGLTALAVPGRHTVHSAPLAALASANSGKISDLIDSSFTPLLPKMTLLQGFDFMRNAYSHHHGQFGNAQFDASSTGAGGEPMASIDQVLATSASFYVNSGRRGRAVCFTANSAEAGSGYEGSATFQNPSTPTLSSIVSTSPVYSNPLTLWDAFFTSGQPAQTPPLKKTLVDRVLADYQALRGNGRLGAEDKRRLDAHIEFLHQTQTRVNEVAPVCSALRPASSPADRKLLLHTLNDVLVSLIGCGLCHSFLGWAQSIASSSAEDYHKWSHEGFDNDTNSISNQTSYTSLVEHNRSLYKDLCLDLATKLDSVGLLDSTFIACVQEHNKRGHESWNVPIVTFGSAGGVFKTGQYLDYRDMANRDDLVYSRLGYPMNQFLSNVLLAMGLPKAEFEALNKSPNPLFKANSGYGVAAFDPENGGRYEDHYANWSGHDLSDWLPMIKA